jgi:3-hydroxyisobutyrate dehydrogenase-like beta-hydroxyacid dehydrogenase
MSRERIGLIGVGLLGSALAERLVQGGFHVLGTDLVPERRDGLLRLGADIAAGACDVFAACDRVVLSLPTSDEVAAVLAGASQALRSGATVIDTTTGSPEATEAAGRRLAAQGVAYLDAKVSGSSTQARRGEAVLMVGGDAGAFAASKDLFDALGAATYHVGPVGAGARMKLATNVVLGLNRAALAEGLAFARSLGLDPAQTLEVIRAGAASSRVAETKGPRMVSRDFAPEARLSQHLKDVRLILAEARRAGALTPLSRVQLRLLEAAVAAGHGDADNSAVICAFDPPAPRQRTGGEDAS